MNFGGWEILVIAVIVVLLFGGAQLPKLAKSMGSFVSEFSNAKDEAENALKIKKTKKTEKADALKKTEKAKRK
ncbi:MAG: twin-arginine translocase TatA/TatE family subunit [Candidatus Margulisbacteria bacterium]|jgi:sec-independent protein translocase protein TatA|nr:twin-arginine translocase TatA/TatE family subunit [Candidatus Margulisiibacteriota bacterium]